MPPKYMGPNGRYNWSQVAGKLNKPLAMMDLVANAVNSYLTTREAMKDRKLQRETLLEEQKRRNEYAEAQKKQMQLAEEQAKRQAELHPYTLEAVKNRQEQDKYQHDNYLAGGLAAQLWTNGIVGVGPNGELKVDQEALNSAFSKWRDIFGYATPEDEERVKNYIASYILDIYHRSIASGVQNLKTGLSIFGRPLAPGQGGGGGQPDKGNTYFASNLGDLQRRMQAKTKDFFRSEKFIRNKGWYIPQINQLEAILSDGLRKIPMGTSKEDVEMQNQFLTSIEQKLDAILNSEPPSDGGTPNYLNGGPNASSPPAHRTKSGWILEMD